MTTGAIVGSLVQDAVYDALNVAAMTALATGGVHTDVPQDTAFPYVWLTWGDPAEEPMDTFGRLGVISHLEVQAVSDYEGDDQVLDMLNKVAELLHHSNLSVAGWSVPFVRRKSADVRVMDFEGVPLRVGTLLVDVHAIKNS